MIIDDNDYIAHFGTPRHSGRYPWGSGGDVEGLPRNASFLDIVKDLRSKGLTDPEIYKGMDISSTEFRAKITIARTEKKQAQITTAQALKDKGMSGVEAAKQMGIPEPTYRTLLAPGAMEKASVLTNVSEMLKREVEAKTYLDIGSGAESYINTGISPQKLHAAVAILKEQGYNVHLLNSAQTSTTYDTKRKILVAPGVTQKEVFLNQDKIQQIAEFSNDGGRHFGQIHPPISVDKNRILVKYKEDGGDQADGMIYVRPGVKDISLGNKLYAQVRVQVDDSHYLKGMAVYRNDLPPGTDLIFNTQKSSTGNKLDAMKKLTDDKDYPFGSVVRQILENPNEPNEKVTSAMNIVYEQGDWSEWNKNLSSQFLSKQSPTLAKHQLDVTYERRKQEFDEINALTNPTVKKLLIEKFADAADSSAVHLQAASLPSANWHAIIPINSIKPSQVYAPNYRDGQRVILIRYPHGGTFEIPELVVNNKNREAKSLLGDSRDALGIHYTVAKRLSGADFDGDTVLVIPNDSGKIRTSPALEGLKNFDPITAYPGYEGMPKINKHLEMGKISNLITDMTLLGASNQQLAQAIRHSMVVIDAEKHGLNYKLSAEKNGIAALKQEYQGKRNAGAATLISRKKSTERINKQKLRLQKQGGPIDVKTGRKVYVDTGEMRRNKDGVLVPKLMEVNKLARAEDARVFMSPAQTPMEKLYAEHSNKLKALANEARLVSINTPRLKYSESANKVYKKEAESLKAKLALVIRNRPLERQADTIAKAAIKAKLEANPNLGVDSIKKITFKEKTLARARTGATHQDVKITAEEWNAIQQGAISDNTLTQILAKADLDIVKSFATPRQVVMMTPAKTARAKDMLSRGFSRAQIAEQLGVSLTTLDTATEQ